MKKLYGFVDGEDVDLSDSRFIGKSNLIRNVENIPHDKFIYFDQNLQKYQISPYNKDLDMYEIRNGNHFVSKNTLVKIVLDELTELEWDFLKIEEDFPKSIPYFCKIHSRKERANFQKIIKFKEFGQLAQYLTPDNFSFNYRDVLDLAHDKKDDSWWKRYNMPYHRKSLSHLNI